MQTKLTNRDMGFLERYFVDAKGRGFSLSGRVPKCIKKAIDTGFVEVDNCSFFNVRRTKRHFVFTDLAKKHIVGRIASKHALDDDDAHHLVLTGSIHLASSGKTPSLPLFSTENSAAAQNSELL